MKSRICPSFGGCDYGDNGQGGACDSGSGAQRAHAQVGQVGGGHLGAAQAHAHLAMPVAAKRAYDMVVFYLRGRSARFNFTDEISMLALSSEDTGVHRETKGIALSTALIRRRPWRLAHAWTRSRQA